MEAGFEELDALQQAAEPPAKEPPKFVPNLPSPLKPTKTEREAGMPYTAMDWIVALPDGNKYQVKAGKATEAKGKVAKLLKLRPKQKLPRGTTAFRPIDQPTKPPEKRKK
jgi:hypothetical protein